MNDTISRAAVTIWFLVPLIEWAALFRDPWSLGDQVTSGQTSSWRGGHVVWVLDCNQVKSEWQTRNRRTPRSPSSALSHPCFGAASPTKIDVRKKVGTLSPDLSTGGPRHDAADSFRLSAEEGDRVIERLFKRVEGTFDLEAKSSRSNAGVLFVF